MAFQGSARELPWLMHASGVLFSLGIVVIMGLVASDSRGAGRTIGWAIAALTLITAALEARKTVQVRAADLAARGR
jgi:hypothetical protein